MKTTSQLASEKNVDPSSIRRWAKRLGLEKVGRDYVFDAANEAIILEKLQTKPGNPAFVEGNEIGKLGGRPKHKKKRK